VARGVTELLMKITGDNREAVKALNGIEGKMTSFGKNITNALKGVAAAFAIKEVAQFGKDALMAAVDAEEAASAFKTVFGPAVADVTRFVDEFANKAGFASHELEQMLAITGNIVQGLGATERESAQLAITMATLAGDVASFSNAQGGAEAVMAALQSALTGEREALKTYGIVINEADVQTRAFANTGKTAASELTKMEKATATVQIAMERAGKAVGDLDRTADGNANQMRELSAVWKETQVSIGEALIPALEALLPLLKALAEGGKEVAGVIEGGTFFIESFGRAITGNNPGMAKFNMSLRILNEEFGHIEDPVRKASLLISDFAINGGIAEETFTRTQDAIGLTNRQMVAAIKNLQTLGPEFDISTAAQNEMADAVARFEALALDDYLHSLTSVTAQATSASKNLAIEYDGLESATAALDATGEDYLSTLKATNDAQRAAIDPIFAARNAIKAYEAALESANADGKITDDELLNIADHALDARSALMGIGDGGVANAVNALTSLLGISERQANDLMWRLGLVGNMNIRPRFTFSDNGTIQQVHNQLNSINGRQTWSTHTVRTYNVTYYSSHLQPGFADGGITPGGPVMVGERGPELVDLPRGSRVHSNTDSRRLASSGATGGNVTVNVAGSVITERDLVEAVREGLDRTALRNGSTGLN